ncbi:MAG: hypothetical protein J3K34DRAFT_518594 [Monoraphidium minutum]|nr:MAG: hypothetical protein J3K34DRAFT_518594 [Monoraphidium minutum]
MQPVCLPTSHLSQPQQSATWHTMQLTCSLSSLKRLVVRQTWQSDNGTEATKVHALWLCIGTDYHSGTAGSGKLCAFVGDGAPQTFKNAYVLPDDDSAAAHPINRLLRQPLLKHWRASPFDGPARFAVVLQAAQFDPMGNFQEPTVAGDTIDQIAVADGAPQELRGKGAPRTCELVMDAVRDMLALARSMAPGPQQPHSGSDWVRMSWAH